MKEFKSYLQQKYNKEMEWLNNMDYS